MVSIVQIIGHGSYQNIVNLGITREKTRPCKVIVHYKNMHNWLQRNTVTTCSTLFVCQKVRCNSTFPHGNKTGFLCLLYLPTLASEFCTRPTQYIVVWTKWPVCCRRHFQMQFFWRKVLVLDEYFTEACSWRPNWHSVIIGGGNGSAPLGALSYFTNDRRDLTKFFVISMVNSVGLVSPYFLYVYNENASKLNNTWSFCGNCTEH